MRAIRLAIAFLLVLVFVAPASAQQASASSAFSFRSDMAYRPSADVLSTSVTQDSTRHFSIRPDDPRDALDKKRADVVPRSKSTCYMIRSYVFLREHADSDATRLAGETICTPSAKFQLKSAVRLVPGDSH
jgi:hypothetical protein